MLNLFISVFSSSVALGLIFCIYIVAERFFKGYLNLRTKALILKILVFFQPIFILLTMVILVSTMILQENQVISADTYMADSQYLPSSDVYEIGMPQSEQKETAGIKSFVSFSYSDFVTPLTYLSYAWFVVAFLLILQKSIGYLRFKKLLMQGGLYSVDRCNCSVKVYMSKLVSSPLLVGFFNPFVIIPDFYADEFELSLILKHEEIHFMNRDVQLKFALEWLKSINWFNPAIHIIQRKFNCLTELITDDIVTDGLSAEQRREYGLLLFKFSENNMKKCPIVFSQMSEEGKNLANRLELIMEKEKNRKLSKFITVVAIMIVALTVGAGAYVTTEAYANAAKAKTDISNASSLKKNNGKLIFDDGAVKIFDGDADENVSSGLAEAAKIKNNAQISNEKAADISDKISDAELNELKQSVLEKGEYFAEAKMGDNIYSLCSGTVVSSKYETAYGYCVTVKDENGALWKYGHCSELLVKNGESVSAGDIVAYAGKTGLTERESISVKLISKEREK